MDFLQHFNITGSWFWSSVVWVLVLALVYVTIRYWARIKGFSGEVRGELLKASWPWESDPKIKGVRKYKELIDSTVVVLIAMVLVAGFVQFWDFLHVMIVSFFTGLGR